MEPPPRWPEEVQLHGPVDAKDVPLSLQESMLALCADFWVEPRPFFERAWRWTSWARWATDKRTGELVAFRLSSGVTDLPGTLRFNLN